MNFAGAGSASAKGDERSAASGCVEIVVSLFVFVIIPLVILDHLSSLLAYAILTLKGILSVLGGLLAVGGWVSTFWGDWLIKTGNDRERGRRLFWFGMAACGMAVLGSFLTRSI